jgi:hypothetical protein
MSGKILSLFSCRMTFDSHIELEVDTTYLTLHQYILPFVLYLLKIEKNSLLSILAYMRAYL